MRAGVAGKMVHRMISLSVGPNCGTESCWIGRLLACALGFPPAKPHKTQTLSDSISFLCSARWWWKKAIPSRKGHSGCRHFRMNAPVPFSSNWLSSSAGWLLGCKTISREEAYGIPVLASRFSLLLLARLEIMTVWNVPPLHFCKSS